LDMRFKDFLTILLTTLMLFGAAVKPVVAQYGQYGEVEVSKDISVDKKVKHPQLTTKGGEIVWVDNLFVSDYKFSPQEEVEFKITITNTGQTDLDNVDFKDYLPDYLEYLEGDFDVIFSLKAGESRDFYLKARVLASEKLPHGVYCLVNTARAAFDGQADEDTAQICLEKQVLGMAVIPETGPAENLAVLIGSVILGLTGAVLVKKKA
jgi:uncharacterized repeat protein (TIGR01451 family)